MLIVNVSTLFSDFLIVILALAFIPSHVAVIVTDPADNPVTTPLLTVATLLLLVAHVIVEQVAPVGSILLTESLSVFPTSKVILVLFKVIFVTFIGIFVSYGSTIIFELALTSSQLATIIALPGATPVTMPLLTVAAFSLLEVHVIFLQVALVGSIVAIVNLCVFPTLIIAVLLFKLILDTTGSLTVTSHKYF